ncbi:trkA-C domain protein [bacterium BMS3Abin04]|nr:trkA-C domain protein [bacterium BMS3Abin04]
MIVASDIAKKDITFVYPSENLDDVLNKFERKNVEEFPVVSESDATTILGTISRQSIIKAYSHESLKYNLAEGMAKKLKFADEIGITNVTKGFSIIEKNAPHEFIGKSLAQLKIRNKYGLEVLMIKKAVSPFADESKNEQIIQPDPDYIIQNGDLLVLFGNDEEIKKVKSW